MWKHHLPLCIGISLTVLACHKPTDHMESKNRIPKRVDPVDVKYSNSSGFFIKDELPREYLRTRTTVDKVEKGNPIFFGVKNKDWEAFKNFMLPEDALWEFEDSGGNGYCIVRGNKAVAYLRTGWN
jgi:hypothetical protein